ncbi:hypothetical protein EV421DRAFT_117121 [Armillaria borealis]|uniref:Uncharacterized protein n=1 Tax=Armillaria borealis TaxID=47425 RepID=A0AA39JTE1_9AGAR|nr:hypothetical protein EV421DRAFT_117121 [Armillaria borealis]
MVSQMIQCGRCLYPAPRRTRAHLELSFSTQVQSLSSSKTSFNRLVSLDIYIDPLEEVNFLTLDARLFQRAPPDYVKTEGARLDRYNSKRIPQNYLNIDNLSYLNLLWTRFPQRTDVLAIHGLSDTPFAENHPPDDPQTGILQHIKGGGGCTRMAHHGLRIGTHGSTMAPATVNNVDNLFL